MKENKTIELLSLSPKDDLFKKDDSKYSYYKNIFDNAFKSIEKNQNIAISGKYGSGKSSLIYSYVKDESTTIGEKQTLKINFSNLSPKSGKKKKESNGMNNYENRFINEIALSIINQIIYQIDHRKIPLTHFKIKEQRDEKTSKSVLALLFTIAWIPLINIIFSYFPKYINSLGGIVIFAICMITSFFVINPLLKFIQNFDIRRLKFGFNNIEADINYENDDFFEEYIDEIIYLFTSVESDKDSEKSYILIIEDLDRFDNTEIFRKLKDLNIKLNQKSESNWIFLYLVKDQLFQDDKERTKFFDLIIPVIPFITSHNSYYKLKELFKEQLDEDLIFFASRFIDDYRLLSNVYNEYIIFSDLINERVNECELFSLIVYKNIFPDKFDDLQNGGGILNEILNSYIDDINYQISDAEEVIVNMERDSLNRYLENNYVTIPDLNKFQKSTNINASDFNKITKYDYILRDSRHEELRYSELKEKSIYREKYFLDGYNKFVKHLKMLKSHDLSCISENVISGLHSKDDENYIKEFSLVYGLIKKKYLTVNYLNTINYLYGNPNDFTFIDNIIKRNKVYDIRLKITGFDSIIRQLNAISYAWNCPQIFNVNLLKYILDKGGHNELFNRMMEESENGFIESFINDYGDYVTNIYKRYPKLSLDINRIKMNHKNFLFIINNNIYVHSEDNEKVIADTSEDLDDVENLQIINNEFVDIKTKKQVIQSLGSINLVDVNEKDLWNLLISSDKINHTLGNAMSYYEHIEEHSNEFYDYVDEIDIPYDTNLTDEELKFLNNLLKDSSLHIKKFSEIVSHLSKITLTNSDILNLSDSKMEQIIDRFNFDLNDDDLFNRISDSSIKISDDDYIKFVRKYNSYSDDETSIAVRNNILLKKSFMKNDLDSFKFTTETLMYRDIEREELLSYLKRIKNNIDPYKKDLSKIIKIIEAKPNSKNAKVLKDDLGIMINLVHYMKEKGIIEIFKLSEDSRKIQFH